MRRVRRAASWRDERDDDGGDRRRPRGRPQRAAAAARRGARARGRRRGRRRPDRAARRSRAHRPRVLVLDLNMPGGSSLDAIPELRESTPETAIVVLTMQDDPAFAREALQRRRARLRAQGGRRRRAGRGRPARRARASTYLNPRLGARLAAAAAAAGRAARRPDRARGRGAAPDRARPHQRRDRRAAVPQRAHGRDAPRAHPAEAAAAPRAPSSCATRSSTASSTSTTGSAAAHASCPSADGADLQRAAEQLARARASRRGRSRGAAPPGRSRAPSSATLDVAATPAGSLDRDRDARGAGVLDGVGQRLLDDPVERGLDLGASGGRPSVDGRSSTSSPWRAPMRGGELLDRRRRARARRARPGAARGSARAGSRSRRRSARRPARIAARIAPASSRRRAAGSEHPQAAEALQRLVVQLARPAARARASAAGERVAQPLAPRPTARWRPRSRRWRRTPAAAARPRRRTPARRRGEGGEHAERLAAEHERDEQRCAGTRARARRASARGSASALAGGRAASRGPTAGPRRRSPPRRGRPPRAAGSPRRARRPARGRA